MGVRPHQRAFGRRRIAEASLLGFAVAVPWQGSTAQGAQGAPAGRSTDPRDEAVWSGASIDPTEESMAALAYEAATGALRDARIEPASIDAVVAMTTGATGLGADLAAAVANRLRLRSVVAWDIDAARSGVLDGLLVAAALVESRRADHVLVLGGDAVTEWAEPEDTAATVIGQGAGAVVIGRGGPWSIGPIRRESRDRRPLPALHAAPSVLGRRSSGRRLDIDRPLSEAVLAELRTAGVGWGEVATVAGAPRRDLASLVAAGLGAESVSLDVPSGAAVWLAAILVQLRRERRSGAAVIVATSADDQAWTTAVLEERRQASFRRSPWARRPRPRFAWRR